MSGRDWDLAREWRAAGVSDAEIGRRLGVAHTTISRRLGPREQATGQHAEPLLPAEARSRGADPEADAERAGGDRQAAGQSRRRGGRATRSRRGARMPRRTRGPGPVIGEGVFASRYAGAMLLHAFLARADAGAVLGAGRSRQDAALLTAVSMCFALGAATIEQFKHLAAADAGPLAGLGALPALRTLRPRLAAIADGTDPVAVQAAFAAAMLAADPVTSGVYYVDDHFIPYAGAKPVAKGWNNKRGKAERGRADTHVTAHDGRAVCFVTGEPSGLSVTLPAALAELKKAARAGARDHARVRPRRRVPAGVRALP